jgi:CcmD family protein
MSRWTINVGAWRSLAAWGAVAMAILGGNLVALAQTQQNEFEKLTGPPTEGIPAAPLVMTAYAFVWVALLVYVFLLWRRIGRVEQELAQVNARLANRR